jgi:hypothetical protein|tara:strand:+ start:233 stop:400 length:168 start_codon:yes stop_codon:yes gene_type:complete
MVIKLEITMTALEDIQEVIRELEASLATDFLTDSVRDIMTRAVNFLKDAESQLDG